MSDVEQTVSDLVQRVHALEELLSASFGRMTLAGRSVRFAPKAIARYEKLTEAQQAQVKAAVAAHNWDTLWPHTLDQVLGKDPAA